MKDLISYIAKSLVDDPTQVEVTEKIRGKDVRIELSVAEEDMGRVIGRGGRVANAMRSLLRVSSLRNGYHSNLDIH